MAESTIELVKSDLITPRGPWHGLGAIVFALLSYIDWFNHRRVLHQIGRIPPAEFGAKPDADSGQLQLAGVR